MKHFIILLISILFSVSCCAQELHFIYVRLDISLMDAELLQEQIEKLKNSFSDSDFIVYYSNENTTMNRFSWDQDLLFGQINRQNSSIAISIPDECENISVPLEQHLQEKTYNNLYFHCFVSSDFLNCNYQDEILARVLITNSLIQPKYSIFIHYYPCGASYTYEKTKFKSEYNINVITKIISSL